MLACNACANCAFKASCELGLGSLAAWGGDARRFGATWGRCWDGDFEGRRSSGVLERWRGMKLRRLPGETDTRGVAERALMGGA